MIKINLEDIVGNAMYDLYCEKGINTITIEKLDRYKKKIFSIIEERNIKYVEVSHHYDFKELEQRGHFDVMKNEDGDDVLIAMRGYVNSNDLAKYRNRLPFDLLTVFGDDRAKMALGIVKFEEASLKELIDKAVENPQKFYEAIADNLTEEEYLFIKENLENKSCHSCRNVCGKTEQNGKPVFICEDWENKVFVGKSKVLGKKDIYKLKNERSPLK